MKATLKSTSRNTLWAMLIVMAVALFTTAAIIHIVHLTKEHKINWNN